MRLDPNHDLAPATIEAMRDLFVVPEIPKVDDADLLRLAMGIADEETRRACTKAMVASPAVRERLVRMRARLRDIAKSGDPSGDDRLDLERLGVFPERFDQRRAAAVFPERFGEPEVLERLVRLGWVEERSEGEHHLVLKALASGVPSDEGWAERYVLDAVETARRIDRVLAEGRWREGSDLLKRELPGLRAAWQRAGAREMDGAVETLARTLIPVLMENGASADVAHLCATGHQAAERSQNLFLRSWLLSMEGAAAARVADPNRARARWTERLRLARLHRRPVTEVDTLLDLANLSYGEGDYEAWGTTIEEVEPLVAALGRPDFTATLLAMRAVDRVRVGDREAATRYASRALDALNGAGGLLTELFVRINAVRTLVACGRSWDAVDALTGVLALCEESGRPVDAAFVLADLADVVEALGRTDIAARCLATALAVHRSIGTRHLGATLDKAKGHQTRHPGVAFPTSVLSWGEEVRTILNEIAELRRLSASVR